MRGSGTLYSLSKEGKGSAGALVAGLTVAVTDAAEEFARRSPGGRMPVPLVVVLDEAANVCRWPRAAQPLQPLRLARHLPADDAAVVVAGRRGLGPRRDAQAVVGRDREGLRRRRLGGRVPVGPLAADRRVLPADDVRVAGAPHDRAPRHAGDASASASSTSPSWPACRAAARSCWPPGAPPALVQTLPWMSGPFAAEIRASLQTHDPATPRVDRARPAGEAAVNEPCYATVEDFVRELLAPMYRRALDGTDRSWCPEWWRHAEAISRLDALWRAWEHLRLDPDTGMSVWFRDHADHHMAVLLDSEGPFKRCSPIKGHRALDELPLEPPPEGLFVPMLWAAPSRRADGAGGRVARGGAVWPRVALAARARGGASLIAGRRRLTSGRVRGRRCSWSSPVSVGLPAAGAERRSRGQDR